jgi:hypothetical protein
LIFFEYIHPVGNLDDLSAPFSVEEIDKIIEDLQLIKHLDQMVFLVCSSKNVGQL